MARIVEDERPIAAIWSPGEDESSWATGLARVTKIEPYEENGHCAAVTWFKIWRGDHLVARVNAMHVECITYEEPTDG